MEQEKIERINALARKSKAEALTDAEKAEQQALRKEYLSEFRSRFEAQLNNTFVVDENGNERRLTELRKKPK